MHQTRHSRLVQEGARSQILLQNSPRVIFESNETAHSDNRQNERDEVTRQIKSTINVETPFQVTPDGREIGAVVI